MDLIEAIKMRKSIRGYKADPVPAEILREILEIASRAPSPENYQPWEFTVIAGEVLEKIKKAYVERALAGEWPRPNVVRSPYQEKLRERQMALGIQLFQLQNIDIDDLDKKVEWRLRGFRFFDAPAAIIISIDEALSDFNRFDIGTVSQTIALAALNYGLGTCISGQGARYPDILREFTGIPDSKRIIISITIGYPDWDFPANKVQSEREPIDTITTWHGF